MGSPESETAAKLQEWLFAWDRTQASRDTQGYLFSISQLGLRRSLSR